MHDHADIFTHKFLFCPPKDLTRLLIDHLDNAMLIDTEQCVKRCINDFVREILLFKDLCPISLFSRQISNEATKDVFISIFLRNFCKSQLSNEFCSIFSSCLDLSLFSNHLLCSSVDIAFHIRVMARLMLFPNYHSDILPNKLLF